MIAVVISAGILGIVMMLWGSQYGLDWFDTGKRPISRSEWVAMSVAGVGVVIGFASAVTSVIKYFPDSSG